MSSISVLIVDDHNLFRQGLIRILEDYEDLQVIGQAANGQEALALVEQLKPDVVLMDLNMPVMSGPEAASRMRESHPELPIIMLTVSERDEDLFDAIRAGAQGYLLKNLQTSELVQAIHSVYAGEAIVAPSMAARLLEEFRKMPTDSSSPLHPPAIGEQAQLGSDRPGAGPGAGMDQAAEQPQVEELSEREVDVLKLVAQGLANKEIAEALSLSEHTVKTHLRNILEKLHLRSRAHAAAYAVRAGIVRDVQTGRQ